jgi:hypothetical protein
MHLDISDESFYARIYRENAARQMEHPDLYNPGLNTYRKNPSV